MRAAGGAAIGAFSGATGGTAERGGAAAGELPEPCIATIKDEFDGSAGARLLNPRSLLVQT